MFDTDSNLPTLTLRVNLIWCLLMSSAGVLATDSDRDGSRDKMLHNAGYPKPGDIPMLNRKIFKGQRVSIMEHPYVASIRRRMCHYLTGVLMTKSVVLTVAHALLNVPVPELSVVLGENYNDRGTIMYTVILVIVHQDFDEYTLQNDIAMVKIYEQITYKINIKNILMAGQAEELEGKTGFVTGWGRCDNMGMDLCVDRTTSFFPDERTDPMLRTISFKIRTQNFYCDQYKNYDVVLRPGMMCAGVAREEDQVAPCLAVPGAPLVVSAKLMGLLSWGFGCGYSYDMPLVYTQISYFLPWLIHNNKMLFNVKHENLTRLFEATKSAVLSEWLIESRNITPEHAIRSDRTIDPMPVDHELSKARGKIYDVRDYVLDGLFKEEKKMMYEALRKEVTVETYTGIRRTTTTGRPFLNKDAFTDEDA